MSLEVLRLQLQVCPRAHRTVSAVKRCRSNLTDVKKKSRRSSSIFVGAYERFKEVVVIYEVFKDQASMYPGRPPEETLICRARLPIPKSQTNIGAHISGVRRLGERSFMEASLRVDLYGSRPKVLSTEPREPRCGTVDVHLGSLIHKHSL